MVFAVLLAACGGVKQAKRDMLILNQGKLDTLPNLTVQPREAVIQPDDILSITVYSDNPEATAIFNQQGAASLGANIQSGTTGITGVNGASGGTKPGVGYLVDKSGEIRLQSIGKIKAAGLTRMQLMDTINNLLQPFLKNPYADIRFLNTRVTVIGEVQRPGVFSLPNEKVSVLELIGMAGDLTMYGKRDNILVVREVNGKREFGRLDLRKSEIFTSPYFYLQQNDVVVIEPSSKKPTATEQDNLRKLTMVTYLATLVSTISILITLFR